MGQRALRNPCEHTHNGSILVDGMGGRTGIWTVYNMQRIRILRWQGMIVRLIDGEKGVEIFNRRSYGAEV